MSVFLPIVFLLTGLASGAMLVWLALRSKTTEAEDRGRLTAQAEHAALIERLQGKEAQIHTAGDQLRSSQTELSQSRAQLQQESKLRATAEANAARIPELNALLKDREQEINQRLHEIAQLRTQLAHTQTTLDKDRTATEEKLTLLNTAQQQLANAFKAISTEALKHNNESFLSLAETVLRRFHNGAKDDLGNRQSAIDALVQPVKAALDKVDGQLAQIENNRTATYATLAEQVKSLGIGCARLQTETANLVQALRAPQVRGRWGEIQLKRVAEMAGMIEYCDFTTQETVASESGRLLRPDMIVKLPGTKQVVVDSKCPLQAYLDALAATDEGTKTTLLREHARQVRAHITKLSAKTYWEQFPAAPEFVVLFLPGETFFSAALESDPSLIEAGVEQRVILATPTTLIALLRAVSFGWRQERITKNAEAISQLGRELYERTRIVSEHLGKRGISLGNATKLYNDLIGSIENRFLVSARRFKELGAGSDTDIPELTQIDLAPRIPKAAG